MKRPDVIAFLHLLLDMFGPLCALSLTLQSDQTVGNVLLSSRVTIGRGKLDTIVLYM